MDNIRMFQYNPESLQDSKQTNYQNKEIPGGSLPLYQWLAGGERLISFTAMFTNDVEPEGDEGEYSESQMSRFDAAGIKDRNVDISGAVAWLRQYLYPSYQQAIPQTLPPRKLILVIPKTYIDTVHVIMTQCDVTLEACWPGGAIREATVQLSFAEIAQIAGEVSFPGSSTNKRYILLDRAWDSFKSIEAIGRRYTLKPNRDVRR
jgi:hypothetical protein